jgi:(4S)-4-hydroxy-5-phosphonooxypentane-2,3-dione isomerase
VSVGASADRHVVIVFFEVRPESRDAFRKAVLENAAASVRDEPGCLTFDVCEDAAGEFFLYELYASAKAFEVHLAMPHFKAFDALCRDWVVSKRVQRYERLAGA